MEGISQRVRSYFNQRLSVASSEPDQERSSRQNRHSSVDSPSSQLMLLDGIAPDSPVDPLLRFPPTQTVRVRLVPYNPYFPVIEKDIIAESQVPIGRFQRHADSTDPFQEGIYFRSTVVSRKHAVLQLKQGQLFIKDSKSLGGTFVNSTRLSAAGKESLWTRLNLSGGDILQFGIDYRPDAATGQVRNKDRAVEVRVEILTPLPGVASSSAPQQNKKRPQRWKPAQHQHTECCICLSKLYLQQALFIAPCQHTYHYRCIAPLLFQRSSGLFSCPLCRAENDLVGGFVEDDQDSDTDSDDAQRRTDQRKETQGDSSESSAKDIRATAVQGSTNRAIALEQTLLIDTQHGVVPDTSSDTEFDEGSPRITEQMSASSAPPAISLLQQPTSSQRSTNSFANGTQTNRSSVADSVRMVDDGNSMWEVRGQVARRVGESQRNSLSVTQQQQLQQILEASQDQLHHLSTHPDELDTSVSHNSFLNLYEDRVVAAQNPLEIPEKGKSNKDSV